MALNDEQKQRIREEESERAQVRRELLRSDPRTIADLRKTAIFYVVFVIIGIVLVSVVKSCHNH
jgi:hypothetical protein